MNNFNTSDPRFIYVPDWIEDELSRNKLKFKDILQFHLIANKLSMETLAILLATQVISIHYKYTLTGRLLSIWNKDNLSNPILDNVIRMSKTDEIINHAKLLLSSDRTSVYNNDYPLSHYSKIFSIKDVIETTFICVLKAGILDAMEKDAYLSNFLKDHTRAVFMTRGPVGLNQWSTVPLLLFTELL